jgi:4-amino-4-deoxy-L-arabinose transferase-like glycosyltransferase
MLENLKKQITNYPFIYSLLFLLLLVAFFVRVYRVETTLGFYYDQGRDALVIWDLIHKGKLFLIGPTTGIAGIFRGPWYYYLIAPFYFLGGGDPIWPSVFLSATSITAIFFLYLLGKEIGGTIAGLVAAIVASFSFYLVYASRWLSNPTPMLLISTLLVWSMLAAIKKKKWAWPTIAFLVGMALQFGSAAEVFYVPAVLIFAYWQRKNLPNRKILFISFLLFFVTILPLLLFDLRHNFILSNNVKNFFNQGSFQASFWETVKIRLPFYYDVFASKIWPGEVATLRLFVLVAFGVLLAKWKELWAKDGFKVLLLLLLAPMVGMLFFQGNEGNVYDYYFTGYYLIFVLLLSVLLGVLAKNRIGKLIVITFLVLFLKINLPVVKGYITTGVDGPTTILLGNQKEAIDWVYKDAEGADFNVDVYVPPVIPYAYDYLFKWYGGGTYGKEPLVDRVSLLYTLYEVDPPHPERLDAWLARQKGIGKVQSEVKIGGITVQRRVRLK